ncbi:hypothetical protein SpCBS45565_g07694 [Spizellomyces sp. 'palustris']|nr:hypothetical protein SpCBS45565_g07694 [Spizellomyces sp. 'palustris']
MADIDRTFRQLERNMQRVLRDVLSDVGPGSPLLITRGPSQGGQGRKGPPAEWMPPVDVLDAGDHFLIYSELPGVSKDKVKVELSDENTLMISGEYPKPEIYDKAQALYAGEIMYGKFARAIPLPPGKFDPNKVEAKLENGLLTVKVGKAEQPQPKQITVE